MSNTTWPVYTEFAECQDCYKCVRECPVKAIKLEDNHASIIPELCIHCGNCVLVCPQKAKKIRDDIPSVSAWLQLKKPLAISVAPSWRSEYPHWSSGQLVAALHALGFSHVSETAIGAEILNRHTAQYLDSIRGQTVISSACPAVVDLILKHYPEYRDNLLPFASPLLTHAKWLKETLGETTKVVFVGPCIAKKTEADAFPKILDAALTFPDLDILFRQYGIDPAQRQPTPTDCFGPTLARDGALYPIDGGMLAGVRRNCTVTDARFMTLSGLPNIKAIFRDLKGIDPDGNLFLELLACEGGCINGPCTNKSASIIHKRFQLLQHLPEETTGETVPDPETDNPRSYLVTAEPSVDVSEEQIQDVFRILGKASVRDELNCSGCGYNSCRDFARAVVTGRAEPQMCVSALRKQSQRKASALFRNMPSGLVIVKDDLSITESNVKFFEVLGLDKEYSFTDLAGFEGAYLDRLITFDDLFRSVLDTGIDLLDQEVRYKDSILNVSVFTIEPHRYVGGIIQDITEPAVHREETIRKTRQVIKKHLATVQKVAYLLGEGASDIESTLNSIADSYRPQSKE